MKIGFIDHHLNNYHANKFHGLLTGGALGETAEIVAAYESHPVGEDWCAAKGVKKVDSAAEVVSASDAIIVLAPDNIDAHLELGREALASGKPVLMDKTLATTMEDAKEILELARKHNTPLMASSSLRFSMELEGLLKKAGSEEIDGIFSRGFGHFRGYSIHTIAPVLRLLNSRVKRVIDTGRGAARLVTVEAENGKRALIDVRESENQMDVNPWSVGFRSGDSYHVAVISKFDEFYANLMKHALEFFKSGNSPVSLEEQLDAVAVEVLADESLAQGGEWVSISR